MQVDELKIKVFDKIVSLLKWTDEQITNDPAARNDRIMTSAQKLVNSLRDQIDEFFECPEEDERDNQDDSIFEDDDIAVGPGRETATDFMDPPGDDDFDDNDGPDFDTGSEGYDDGFPK